jgi:hypothetical protein
MREYIILSYVIATSVVGSLLLFEVVRPFRDMKLDGPIALVLICTGLVLALLSLFFGWSRPWIGIVGIVVNGVLILGVLAVYILLSRNNRLF